VAVPAQWAEPSIHPTYARLLCALLRRRGLDTREAPAALGMTEEQLARAEDLLSFAQMRRLMRKAVELSGSPSLGLELGPATQASAHGPVGYAAVASSNLAEALEVVAQYGSARHRGLDFRLAAKGDRVTLTIHERFDFGDVRIFTLETVLVTILGLLETLLGQPLEGAECLLPYPAPRWAAEYARHVQAAVRFGAVVMQIRLPRDVLERPCLTADAHAFASARRECERTLADDGGAAQRVRLRLRACERHYPGLGAMAGELHISARTLMRRLKQEGTSFQELLDEVRRERAEWYLRHTPDTVEAIAERLGYQDTSNFSRTFRRWAGVAPREFRARGGAGS
jgi:AraC-like DNA-binding protein